MRPKLRNIGEKWFILSFDLRVFIEKGALLAKKDTATKRCLLWGARTDSVKSL